MGSFRPQGYAYLKDVVYEGYEVSKCPALEVPEQISLPSLTVQEAILQRPDLFLSREDALEEWLYMMLRRRLDQLRPNRRWKTA